MLTRKEVLQGFLLILGREPESERAIEYHRNHPSVAEFGRVLRESEEFQSRAARDRLSGGEHSRWVRSELPSGLSLWVDLYDGGVSAGVLRGVWEPAETNFMLSVLKPGDCIVDVGANLGWYTVTLAQAVGPDGHVYAFEPRSDIFARLERSVSDNGFADRCTLRRMALGPAESRLSLAWSPKEMNQGHSFVVVPNSALTPDLKHEVVPVSTLDSLAIERNIRLIKLDVEGAEPGVLLGARGLIERDRPIIVSEVFPKWLRQGGNEHVETFLNMLNDIDYRAHYLTDDGIGGELRLPISDLNSDYVYYSIVFLGPSDRAALLDGRRDGRVRELEARTIDAEHSAQHLVRQATLADERAAGLATDVGRLSRELALAETRASEVLLLRREVELADERSAALVTEMERLNRGLASAEERARAEEFRNLDLTAQLLRMTNSTPDSQTRYHPGAGALSGQASADWLRAELQALRSSTSWRVTAPLRAVRRMLNRYRRLSRRALRQS